MSIWSLFIPVRLTWKPAFETLPSRFGHAVHLKTNACSNKVMNDLCQKLIFYRRRQLSWNEKYKEWTSVNFNSEEAKSWIQHINGENQKHSVSIFDIGLGVGIHTQSAPLSPPTSLTSSPSTMWSGVRSSCRCLLVAQPTKSMGRTSEIGGKW